MGATLEDIELYLDETEQISLINNNDQRFIGKKTNQLLFAIQHTKDCAVELYENTQDVFEQELLDAVLEDVENLPTGFSLYSLYAITTQLDSIQNNLFNSVNTWINHDKEMTEWHRPLMKSMVFLLRILEYDLSKIDGPIKVGKGPEFLKPTILSNEQREHNLGRVREVLAQVMEAYEKTFEHSQNAKPK